MFYLHGKIIEDQGIQAVSPDYGAYEYKAILNKLEMEGFVVISEHRPKNADADVYAQRVVSQINLLLKAGIPPEFSSVVGASKGSYIAAAVSFLIRNDKINYVLVGSCSPEMVTLWKENQQSLFGNVLAIYDYADKLSGSCAEIFSLSQGKGIGRHNEIVLRVGTGHGIIFKPLDEWVIPTVEWAKNQ